jgi:sulfur carrier protein ThiS adenylyltransferase
MTANQFLNGLGDHFTADQIRRLGAVCVGIAGAGGLGSNTAAHLVRSGIRRLVVADFDHVAPSNLNRQFFFIDQVGMKKVRALDANLRRINPDVELLAWDGRLDAGNVRQVFRDCDLIVEALDHARDKRMMAEAFMADPRLLVCASGIGGWGRSDRIRTRRVHDAFYLIGDEWSEVSAALPPTAAIVGIAAAKQADVVVERILSERGRGVDGPRIQGREPAT